MQRELNNEEVTYLRKKHLVEGRKPNLYLSKGVAQTTGQKVAYSKHKGLNSKACEDLLLESLHDHKSLTKEEIVNLLWKVLPDVLSDAQKSNKVNNMLTKLRQKNKIYCISRGRKSIWYLANN